MASTPGWEKKFLSSADKKEFIILFGIALNGTNILDTARWRFKTNNSPEEFNQSWDLDFNPPQIKLSAIYNFGNQSLKTKKKSILMDSGQVP